MKIYMVIADNGQAYEEHDWWNVAAFTSEEAANEYIMNFIDEIDAAERREEELARLTDERALTPEEEEEYEEVNNLSSIYWHFFDHGKFRIEEYELRS